MSVYRAGFWLYATSLASQLGGYVFWFVVAASVGVGELGEVAFLVSVAGVFSTALGLGLGPAVMRLWPASGDRRFGEGGLGITLALAAAGSAALALWRPVVGFLVGVGLLSSVYSSFFQVLYDTRPVFLATVVGQAARVAAAPFLAGLGADALAASYGFPGVLLIALGAARLGLRPRFWGMGELLRAGLSAWAPGVVSVFGTNLGVVAAYGMASAEAAGLVYIAQVLANAAVGVSTVVTGVLLPYVSSSADRAGASARAARLAFVLSAPLTLGLVGGGVHVLSLLGRRYAEAWDALAVFSAANLLSLGGGVLSTYVYAEGRYAAYLAGGSLANGVRVGLYPLFSSSDVGVAFSFLAGSLVGGVFFSLAARNVAGRVWGPVPRALLASLPALFLSPLGLAGLAAGAAASYLLAFRLGLVSRGELGDLARQVLPQPLYLRLAPLASRILDVVGG